MNNGNMNNGNMSAGNNNFGNINPNNFDTRIKNQLINQNIYHSGYGIYKTCPINGSIKFNYRNKCDPGTIDNICKVIVCNKHAIEIADSLCEHGLNSLTTQKPIPAIMYPMGKNFLGTNYESREGVYDENIILRSNYAYVIKKQNNLFPIKKEHAVIYTNPITIIRDVNYNPINHDTIFKVCVITVCAEKDNDLIVRKTKLGDKLCENSILTATDLLNFQMHIEAVFQAAICGFHNVLILTLFSEQFSIPIDDQILIFNICIMKYGHKFKGIMIAIPPYENAEIFEYVNEKIIKPHDMIKDVDMKYEEEIMAQRIMGTSDDDKPIEKDSIKKKMASMTNEERVKMLKNIVKKRKMEKKHSVK